MASRLQKMNSKNIKNYCSTTDIKTHQLLKCNDQLEKQNRTMQKYLEESAVACQSFSKKKKKRTFLYAFDYPLQT